MKILKKILLILMCFPLTMCSKVDPPVAFGPVPTERQMKWHETEFYAFLCITTNTFNDLEWGYGDADPNIFNPTDFDPDQWMEAVKGAGMKGVVLTCKHHDGFCLWPSDLTDYSVKNCQWRDGKGDMVGDVARAAKKYGLKFGVYLSPWDRHDLRYGSPEYVEYYRGQLRELLTRYGDVFEVWEDGANGGDGYYGGLCEERRIQGDYYQWGTTNMVIRELQPEACIFGGDVRWCGNESGYIDEPWWCAQPNTDTSKYEFYGCKETDKEVWIPAEVDVSIRPGWFYHESEDDKVRSVDNLLDIYYSSIGRGANLILNIPPNKKGLFNEEDLQSLEGLGKALKEEFGNCLNKQIAKAEASNTRGEDRAYSPKKATDGKKDTYWATDDEVKEASVTYTFKECTTVNRAMIQEYIPLGQRVSSFQIEAQDEYGQWQQVASGTNIGYKKLVRFPDFQARAMRVSFQAKACPVISNISFFQSTYNGYVSYIRQSDGVYQISTAQDLADFAKLVNSGEHCANAVLTADIDMSGISYIPPIGTLVWPQGPILHYGGTFDGQGHIIHNLRIEKDVTGAETGLFGRLSGATIKNLGIVNATIKNASALRAGVLAGCCAGNSTVTNCFTTGDIHMEECVCSHESSNGEGMFGLINEGGSVYNSYTTYGKIAYPGDNHIIQNCYDGENAVNWASTGELCYKLNGDQQNVVWYQNLGEDAYPVLNTEQGTVVQNKDGGYKTATGIKNNVANK